jgi:hypothetical protein
MLMQAVIIEMLYTVRKVKAATNKVKRDREEED